MDRALDGNQRTASLTKPTTGQAWVSLASLRPQSHSLKEGRCRLSRPTTPAVESKSRAEPHVQVWLCSPMKPASEPSTGLGHFRPCHLALCDLRSITLTFRAAISP